MRSFGTGPPQPRESTLCAVSRILICALLVALLPAATPSSGTTRSVQPDLPGDAPALPAGQFGWPLPGRPAVVRGFEAPAHRFGPGHRGVDLAAAEGTPVRAAAAGTVVFAGPVAGRGVISIDHPGGLRTTYEPVAPSVTAGAVVTRGQRIGTVRAGHPGCASCLHWGVRRATEYLDPLRLLGLGRLRLLPWDGEDGR